MEDDDIVVSVTMRELKDLVHQSNRSSEVVGRMTMLKGVIERLDSEDYTRSGLREWILGETVKYLMEAIDAKSALAKQVRETK